jgi:ubiquitin-conjugating enzyme E2 A
MQGAALRRIKKDIEKIQKEGENTGFLLDYEEENLFEMEALMEGPEGTPWEGGMFELTFKFPDEYPNKCPTVVFKSHMFHPNIYADGRICLDLLNTQWSPVYDIWAILISIRSLLCNPNPLSPAHTIACETFLHNKI